MCVWLQTDNKPFSLRACSVQRSGVDWLLPLMSDLLWYILTAQKLLRLESFPVKNNPKRKAVSQNCPIFTALFPHRKNAHNFVFGLS